jgi:uncharacterized membrane protein
MLQNVPFFALLDDQERATLAERIDVVTVPAGDTLFNRGDPGDSMYVVRKGVVEMWFKNDTGDRIVLETAREGDFFGEISLLDGGSRNTSALVKEDMEALLIDRGDLDEFFRLRPAAALDLLAATGRRLRETSNMLARTASRNINDEEEDKRTPVMKIADWISEFSGSIPFLMIHVVLFTLWIVLNVHPLSETRIGGFDPFPFGLLTMVVSLEAIILSVFVLLSQNRQVARDRFRNDIEYAVNLKAELEIAHLHEKFDQMNADVLARLQAIQKGANTANGANAANAGNAANAANEANGKG